MRLKLIFPIGLLFVFFVACQSDEKGKMGKENKKGMSQEISFYTSDSIKIFGDLYELDKKGPTILLFHQGGSNARGEYVKIIPRLLLEGFNILAIDQRMGGQIYGNYNRTIANIPNNNFANNYTYCDAFNNLEGAFDYLTNLGFTGNKILWGSSYSASLAIQLANKRQKGVDGVLAFSPAAGGPMQACSPNPYFETLKVPLLLLRPPNEMKNESSIAQFELAKEYNHQTYVAQYGAHGASMLMEERVGHNTEANWEVVLAFLSKHK